MALSISSNILRKPSRWSFASFFSMSNKVRLFIQLTLNATHSFKIDLIHDMGASETSMLKLQLKECQWSACRACSLWYRGRALYIQRYFQPVQVGFITNICNVLYFVTSNKSYDGIYNRFSRCRIWYFVNFYTAVFLSYLYFALTLKLPLPVS